MDREKILRGGYIRRKSKRKKNLDDMISSICHGVAYQVIIDECEIIKICNKLKNNREYIESAYPVRYHEMRVKNEESMVFFLERFINFRRGFYLFEKNVEEYPVIKVKFCFSPIKFFRNIFNSGSMGDEFHIADIDLKWIFCVENRKEDYSCPEYGIYIDETFPYCDRDMIEYWDGKCI